MSNIAKELYDLLGNPIAFNRVTTGRILYFTFPELSEGLLVLKLNELNWSPASLNEMDIERYIGPLDQTATVLKKDNIFVSIYKQTAILFEHNDGVSS